jgi:hypothetical protein
MDIFFMENALFKTKLETSSSVEQPKKTSGMVVMTVAERHQFQSRKVPSKLGGIFHKRPAVPVLLEKKKKYRAHAPTRCLPPPNFQSE